MGKSVLQWAAAAAAVVVFVGCNSQAESGAGAKPATSAANEAEHVGHMNHEAGHDHGGGANEELSPMDKMELELAKLSPEDAAAVRKQHMCPVSGEMLGVMGPPIKVAVDGRDVWICCEGCRQKLLDDPAMYLAKLKP